MHPLILDVAFRELGVTAEWADRVMGYMASMINYHVLNPQHNLSEKRSKQHFAEHHLKNFGPEHPGLATTRNNLARFYFYEKNFPAAIEHFQEALRIVEKTLGREHPYFKQFSESLATAQQAAGSELG